MGSEPQKGGGEGVEIAVIAVTAIKAAVAVTTVITSVAETVAVSAMPSTVAASGKGTAGGGNCHDSCGCECHCDELRDGPVRHQSSPWNYFDGAPIALPRCISCIWTFVARAGENVRYCGYG